MLFADVQVEISHFLVLCSSPSPATQSAGKNLISISRTITFLSGIFCQSSWNLKSACSLTQVRSREDPWFQFGAPLSLPKHLWEYSTILGFPWLSGPRVMQNHSFNPTHSEGSPLDIVPSYQCDFAMHAFLFKDLFQFYGKVDIQRGDIFCKWKISSVH